MFLRVKSFFVFYFHVLLFDEARLTQKGSTVSTIKLTLFEVSTVLTIKLTLFENTLYSFKN